MTITTNFPDTDEDGFYNFYEGAHIYEDDTYMIKDRHGVVSVATGVVDDCAYFVDEDGEPLDDIEWFKPHGETDRVSFAVSASRDDIAKLTEALRALTSDKGTPEND